MKSVTTATFADILIKSLKHWKTIFHFLRTLQYSLKHYDEYTTNIKIRNSSCKELSSFAASYKNFEIYMLDKYILLFFDIVNNIFPSIFILLFRNR